MTTLYRLTFNVVTKDPDAAFAASVGTIDAHCPVERSDWSPTLSDDIYVLAFTFWAAGDREAAAISKEAGRATSQPHDAMQLTTNRGRRQVATS